MPVSLRPGPDYSFSAALPSLVLNVFKDVLSLVSQTLRLNVPFIKVNYLLVAISSQHTEQPLVCSGAEWLQTVAGTRVPPASHLAVFSLVLLSELSVFSCVRTAHSLYALSPAPSARPSA